jgi:hypothetical protein
VDQGDVQYFIGVQLDGTEHVQDDAAKEGVVLVCILKNHICATDKSNTNRYGQSHCHVMFCSLMLLEFY